MTLQETHSLTKLAYTTDEVMELLGVGEGTVYGLLRSGRLKSVRLNRKFIIPAEAIKEFLKISEDK